MHGHAHTQAHTSTHTHTLTNSHTQTHAHTHTGTHTHRHTQACTRTHTHVYSHMYMRTHTNTDTRAHTHTHTQMRTHRRTHTCTRTHTRTHTHKHARTPTHTHRKWGSCGPCWSREPVTSAVSVVDSAFASLETDHRQREMLETRFYLLATLSQIHTSKPPSYHLLVNLQRLKGHRGSLKSALTLGLPPPDSAILSYRGPRLTVTAEL